MSDSSIAIRGKIADTLSLAYMFVCILVDGASKIVCSYNINSSIEQYQHARKYIAPIFGASNVHERTLYCLFFLGILQLLSSYLLTIPGKVRLIATVVFTGLFLSKTIDIGYQIVNVCVLLITLYTSFHHWQVNEKMANSTTTNESLKNNMMDEHSNERIVDNSNENIYTSTTPSNISDNVYNNTDISITAADKSTPSNKTNRYSASASDNRRHSSVSKSNSLNIHLVPSPQSSSAFYHEMSANKITPFSTFMQNRDITFSSSKPFRATPSYARLSMHTPYGSAFSGQKEDKENISPSSNLEKPINRRSTMGSPLLTSRSLPFNSSTISAGSSNSKMKILKF